MKVVLFKSPKFLGGILRMIFGIKKQNVKYIKSPDTYAKMP